MKKLILSLTLVASFALSGSALTINKTIESINYENVFEIYEVNTFCKLIQKGDFDAVKSMIKAGTNVNQKSMGMTPAMFAARYNKVEILKLLIENGADLKVKSKRGYTALEYAEMSKAHDTYRLISETISSKMKKKKVDL